MLLAMEENAQRFATEKSRNPEKVNQERTREYLVAIVNSFIFFLNI